MTSGASCEANGYTRIKSLCECEAAPQELGLHVSKRGETDNTFSPSGCYLMFDGDLWFNTNVQSTQPCTSRSKCICGSAGRLTHKCGIEWSCHNYGKNWCTGAKKFTVQHHTTSITTPPRNSCRQAQHFLKFIISRVITIDAMPCCMGKPQVRQFISAS